MHTCEIAVIAGLEHLRGEEEHRRKRHRDEGAALKERADDLPGLALLTRGGPGGHALLVPGIAEEEREHAQHGDRNDAGDGAVIVHDALGAVALADGLDGVEAHERHRGHRAEGGADGAEHRQRGALLVAGGDDLRERAVGDVDAGIEHAEEDVRHIGVGEVLSLRQAGDLDEHQYRGHGDGDREDLDPAAVAAVGPGLRAVDDAAPDRVVDRVPDARHDHHRHDADDIDLQDIRVIALQDALHQTEHAQGAEIAHQVADLVFGLDAAGAGNVRLIHGFNPFSR